MRRTMLLSLLIAAPMFVLGGTSASASGWCGYGYGGYRYYAPRAYGYSYYRPTFYYGSYYRPRLYYGGFFRPRLHYGGFYRPRVWGGRAWRGWRRW